MGASPYLPGPRRPSGGCASSRGPQARRTQAGPTRSQCPQLEALLSTSLFPVTLSLTFLGSPERHGALESMSGSRHVRGRAGPLWVACPGRPARGGPRKSSVGNDCVSGLATSASVLTREGSTSFCRALLCSPGGYKQRVRTSFWVLSLSPRPSGQSGPQLEEGTASLGDGCRRLLRPPSPPECCP